MTKENDREGMSTVTLVTIILCIAFVIIVGVPLSIGVAYTAALGWKVFAIMVGALFLIGMIIVGGA